VVVTTAAEQKINISADVASKLPVDAAVKGGYDVELSSRGAMFSRYSLTGYDDPFWKKADGSAATVDLAHARHDGAAAMALRSRGGDVGLLPAADYTVVEQNAQRVVFERMTEAGVRIRRSYQFDANGFAFHHTIELKNESGVHRSAELDLTLPTYAHGMEAEKKSFLSSMSADANTSTAGACQVGDKRRTFKTEEIHDDPADHNHSGTIELMSIDQHYFVAAVTFTDKPNRCLARPWSINDATGKPVKAFDLVVEYPALLLAPGETKTLTTEAYFGPKQIDLLRSFGHRLEESVDFGLLALLCRPMLWGLVHLKGVLGNYGFAVIALTLIIFLMQFPLTHQPQIAMRKFAKVMKDLKPDLDKLKEKYGHDQRTMMEQQQKFMAEKGLDPFAPMKGCLPMLVSMPIWFALYRTLSMSIELYQQPFPQLGILNLTVADGILFGFPLLPLIVCGLMLIQTSMQPPPEDQPQMKYVMWGMPIFFGFLMINMAAGLSIYMITNSLLRMAQSSYIKAKHP
jgi:YidC/Oxa1 family membrane protein insertase